MTSLNALPERYRLILCDVWGVVHDGYTLLPGATELLRQWRDEGRFVLLITNAPRTAEAVEQHLQRLRLPRDAWDAIATSGDAGIEGLLSLGHPVGFLGTALDRVVLEGRGVRIIPDNFTDLAVTGLDEARPYTEAYGRDLHEWAERGVRFHCLNPDRLVIHGGQPMVCAGALADLYEEIGGEVIWYGKPFEPIYRHALHLAGDPPAHQVLAIGDGLQTDILGAARMGFDAVFVRGGVHAGEPFPTDFAKRYGLGDWAPIEVVDSLAEWNSRPVQ